MKNPISDPLQQVCNPHYNIFVELCFFREKNGIILQMALFSEWSQFKWPGWGCLDK